MKHLMFIADGMADYPCRELGGKTPLEAARTPNLDRLAPKSSQGLVALSGSRVYSDTAFLSILGVPEEEWPGRGPLEALAVGAKFSDRDIIARCNLVSEEDGKVGEYLNDLAQSEATSLLASLKGIAARLGARFVPVSGYKHLLIIRNASGKAPSIVAPRTGRPMAGARASGDDKTSALFDSLVAESQKIFPSHPANAARVRAGKKPVASVWFWGAGRLKKTRGFEERFGTKSAVISSVDVIRGIGKWLGAEVINPKGPGAKEAVAALARNDFVIVHAQAPDEAGHEGNARAKVRAIEDFDRHVVGPCLTFLPRHCRVAVLPDHFTPVSLRAHAPDPVPFMLFRPGIPGDGKQYLEASARRGRLGTLGGEAFTRLLFGPALPAKAVLFDLWSTLLVSTKRREHARAKKALGFRMGYKEYLDLQRRYWFESRMDEYDYFSLFLRKIGRPADKKSLSKLVAIWNRRKKEAKPFPDTIATLSALARKYPLAVVSNTENDGKKKIEDWRGIGKFFKTLVHSCDTALRKPDPRIFLEAARRLHAKPSECVMIGDNPKHDVRGAQKAGMRGVWVDRKRKELGTIRPDAIVDSLAELVEEKIL